MAVGKPSGEESPELAPSLARGDHTQLGPDALKAYAHPLRLAILRYLNERGAATSTTLAQYLGESTGQTSYHLRQLAKHGIVEDVPGRGSGRERWWRARSAGVDLSTMLTDESTAAAADVMLAEMLRERTETLARWVGSLSKLSEHERIASRSLHSQATMRLTPEELEELSVALETLVSDFADRFRSRMDGDAPEDAVRVRANLDVFPLLDENGQPLR